MIRPPPRSTQSRSSAASDVYKRQVEIGSDTYELVEYLFTRSGSLDERDIIRYLGSDWQGTKVYSKNDGVGEVQIDITCLLYTSPSPRDS